MAWTSSVTLDADKENVGHATAIWNAGEEDQFTYSRRAGVNASEAAAFVAEAHAALIARDAKASREASLTAFLEGLLNA